MMVEDVNVVDGKKIIDLCLEDDDFELIDVRSPDEYNKGHIKGARLMPLEKNR